MCECGVLQAQFITYNIVVQQWITDTFTFTASGMLVDILYSMARAVTALCLGCNLTAKFFPAGFGDILVWGKTIVFYSSNRGGLLLLLVCTQDGYSILYTL